MQVTEAVRYSEFVVWSAFMVQQQRLNLAKAASVFKMGLIQQTGLKREGAKEGGGEGGKETFVYSSRQMCPSSYRMCVFMRERESMFCNGKTLGAGAVPHI